jgi:myo-inositol-1(or 4)-monophosphatase
MIKEGVDKRMAGSGSIMAKYSNPSDMVTETDQAVEAFVKEKISAAYPSHKYGFHFTSCNITYSCSDRWLH